MPTLASATPPKLLACTSCREKKIKCVTRKSSVKCVRCLARDTSCTRPAYLRLSKPVKLSTQETGTFTEYDLRSVVAQGDDPTTSAIANPALLFINSLPKRGSRIKPILYRIKADNASMLHPIQLGLVSQESACRLFNVFLDLHASVLAYFDPQVHTFEYVSSHSAILLTCILWKAASGLAIPNKVLIGSLFNHMEKVLIPAILLQGLRSVEIVQGLMMLAAFQPPNRQMSEDGSWTLLGHAIRIATDLDIHSKVTSKELLPLIDQVGYLQARNAERTWMNLWLHEASLSQHTGRRSLLSSDDIISHSKWWHMLPHATEADVALVAMIQLRTLITRNRQMYHAVQDHPSEVALDCYLDRCEDDITDWTHEWLFRTSSTLTMRLELGPLYAHHSKVQLAALVFQQPNRLSQTMFNRAFNIIYSNCICYLDKFNQLLPPARLANCYNSIFVSATYIVVLSLRLVKLAPTISKEKQDRILQLAKAVAKIIKEASCLCYDSTGLLYADFLGKILSSNDDEEQIDVETFDTLDGHSNVEPFNSALWEQNPCFYLDDAQVLAWAQSLLSSSSTDDALLLQSES